ncbi:BlaI/MecI/CopY family transcriptional regulator [Tenacibaculum jejuense]|uniref:Transcriptional regulator, MecI family. Putative antibiotic resistance-related regulatory protein n=1 Tax=Tenacibaculum jejuense TaxID=584609 RepID=A0A238UBJ1_9FLAO|nr:BlaI/MecI/CopY family transcriptional regulator [Tenacibaculum jejuense]SNR16435.1 Transcriptional regulator, MecI family. Putative antibiotic resistance-related regulatory protein [Tenacibaculum jejuense]
MNKLTKPEEQIMHYLWKLKKAFLKDIVDEFPEPKPAYTTISTVVRVLVKKQFIDYKTFGKTREYYPLITKKKYFNEYMQDVIYSFFNGSSGKFASYFTENENLNLSELEEIKLLIEEKIQKIKDQNA